jgi:hypothetical protein
MAKTVTLRALAVVGLVGALHPASSTEGRSAAARSTREQTSEQGARGVPEHLADERLGVRGGHGNRALLTHASTVPKTVAPFRALEICLDQDLGQRTKEHEIP